MSSPPVPQPAPPDAFVRLQHLLPQHPLSRIVWWATRRQFRPWKSALIRLFLRHYPVNMDEAARPEPGAYVSFNDFFTRALRPDARAVDIQPGRIVSPVDGTVSEAGLIEADRLLQAKGRHYTLTELLGGNAALAERFHGGAFATLYLAPHDYHRIHMPAAGRLLSTHYIPGRLFSVNAATVQRMPRLFARNERVVCVFDGEPGRFAVILVGALFVGSMSTVWAGEITPARGRRAGTLQSPPSPVQLARGEELGRFNMGSTVIVLFERGRVRWRPELVAGAGVRMGASIATMNTRP
jgi:phosphatidylserine decarboxylase